MIHGELWEKNMMFAAETTDEEEGDSATVDANKQKNDKHNDDDAKIVVLDWKNAKIASATKDLAFFLLSSTSNSLR